MKIKLAVASRKCGEYHYKLTLIEVVLADSQAGERRGENYVKEKWG